MHDLTDRLAGLHDPAPETVSDRAVADDLDRGRAALRTRRRRTGGGVAVATVAAAAVASVALADPGTSSRGTPDAHASIRLVAYSGDQLPGYTVRTIPEGYVLQGISGSVLDVAERGDHSSLDDFRRKLVVMLNDHPGPVGGTAVDVAGHPGTIATSGGATILTYDVGAFHVDVQAWGNIRLTDDQLVQFAEGVTVLPDAQVGHG